MAIDEAVMEHGRIIIGPEGSHTLDGNMGYSQITRGQVTHFGGMSAHIRNRANSTVSISVSASMDNFTFYPVLFSSTSNSSLARLSIVGRGEQTILFETSRRYLKISVAPAVGSGVVVDLVQHPPRGLASEVSY